MSPLVAITALVATLGSDHAPAWSEVEPGLQYTMVQVEGTTRARKSRLHAFRVDLTTHKLLPLDARKGSRTRATVQTLASESKVLLAVNGTYFDERDRPLGLLVGDGRALNPLRRADWGVFHVTAGRAQLVHTTDWRRLEPEHREFAIQVGPRCVVDGQPVKLKAQVARRAALGIQASGHVIIAVSTGELLSSDLALAMATPEVDGGLGCTHAVMLDGGGSAQLWGRVGGRQWLVPGTWPVPNAVALVRR
ncbi:MAG: phosphodiester glycosidase family protein [Myxococcota bacterium]|nr:phosphodiester glycosidase family protein [Myxococcota bacterium]